MNRPLNREITLLDLGTLLVNIHMGANHPDVGFEDAYYTLERLNHKLNKTTTVFKDHLESGLWSCNLLSEQGKFWSPYSEDFDGYLKRVLYRGETFDKNYNLIMDRKRDV